MWRILQGSKWDSARRHLQEELANDASVDAYTLKLHKDEYARNPTTLNKYTYAYSLSKLTDATPLDRRQAATLLQELTMAEDLGDSVSEEAVYYTLALTLYRMEEYAMARDWVSALLTLCPDHRQGLALNAAIEPELAREGLTGVAILTALGGVGLSVAYLAARAIAKRRY
eukprot:TRINITY_DN4691_c0_g1_i1.p1 TRINITY_DN4691_c0_g1~~TRINITY_DN4691_c0_g1_i1.p1  ORF type:complete len:171 (+),score=24.14 TRINITY_DN4691_c0_g1_i1:357-869(+)